MGEEGVFPQFGGEEEIISMLDGEAGEGDGTTVKGQSEKQGEGGVVIGSFGVAKLADFDSVGFGYGYVL